MLNRFSAMLLLSFAVASAPSAASDRVASVTNEPRFRFLTSVIATELARAPYLDIITSEDVRRAVSLEADRRETGACSENECLAELAAAMDARFVVYGGVDLVDDIYLLQLAMFDAKRATSAGRANGRAESAGALAPEAARLAHMLAGGVAQLAVTGALALPSANAVADSRMRVLVLDLSERVVLKEPSAWPAVASWTVLGTGALALGAAAIADAASVNIASATNENLALSASAARTRYAQSDALGTWATVGYVAGALLAVGGAASVLIVSVVE